MKLTNLLEGSGLTVKDLDEYPFDDHYMTTLNLTSKDLISLEGCRKVVVGDFRCSNNMLKTLQYVSEYVGGDFSCNFNQIETLKYCPGYIGGDFSFTNNKVQTLLGISEVLKAVRGTIYCSHNPIKSGGLELLLIKGIKGVDNLRPPFTIISKYIHLGTQDIYGCQEELLKYGFDEYAEL